ncbi:MAG: hypothetical protein HYV07_22755 [Deltaproteobacteria bacterium]|nr:hypothetical protein [Deltaproteobacteria bacterium]
MSALMVALATLAAPSIVELTPTRAYFDGGGRDGVTMGAELVIERNGSAIGTCVVDAVSRSRASCTRAIGELRVGDRVMSLEAGGPPAEVELVRAGRVEPAPLARAAHPSVESTKTDGPKKRAGYARAELSGRLSMPLASASSSYGSGTVSVSLRRASLGFLGLEASADIFAIGGSSGAARFRNGVPSLYVREAAILARSGTFSLALGRVRPDVGALFGLDGALAETTLGDTFDVGAFAGFVPDERTLEPDRAGAGAFARVSGGVGEEPTRLRAETSFSLVDAETGALGQLELDASVSRHDLSAWATARGLAVPRGASLDLFDAGARVELGRDVSMFLELRHRAGSSDTLVIERSTLSGELSFAATPWLRVAAEGGWVDPLDGRFGFFGPRLDWTADGGRLGGSVGYEESLSDGRGGHGSVRFTPGAWSLLLRVAVDDEVDDGGRLASLNALLSVRARALGLFGAATAIASQPLLEGRAPALIGRLSIGTDAAF